MGRIIILISNIATICFYKEEIFSPVDLWSTVQHYVLSHGAVTNKYDGCLDAQTIPSSVRYHKPSKGEIHQRNRKINRGANGGFLHKNHKE